MYIQQLFLFIFRLFEAWILVNFFFYWSLYNLLRYYWINEQVDLEGTPLHRAIHLPATHHLAAMDLHKVADIHHQVATDHLRVVIHHHREDILLAQDLLRHQIRLPTHLLGVISQPPTVTHLLAAMVLRLRPFLHNRLLVLKVSISANFCFFINAFIL